VLLARIRRGPDSVACPKIVVYAHYDIQPAKEPGWKSDPFSLIGVNGYLYGRGSSDNKGPLVAFIHAAKELQEENESFPFEIVMALDGEEENNSKEGGLWDVVESHPTWFKDTTCIVVSNSYWLGDEMPCLCWGMRGVVHMKITVCGPLKNLHAGIHGYAT
jgi:acetylornithine deacetylase/succinyl-diaminopimelate desuccinylase-like protein